MKILLSPLNGLLKLVNGRKTTIGAILALLITYCLVKGYIGDMEAVLFNGILVALGLIANTANYIQGKK